MLLGRLLSGVSAATPENPTFDLNSPEAWDALSGVRSSTGQPVSAESALTWDAWYRGVSLLALYIAKTPLNVWQRVERSTGDGRVMSRGHPVHKLLRWNANEVQTAFQFELALAGHAVNRGNGYAYIWRDGPTPIALTLLDPDATYMPRDAAGRWYVTKIGTESRKIPAADVFHVRGFGFDGFTGYPAFQLAKESIGLATSMVKLKGLRYKNQARPSVVLETAAKMLKSDRAELREDWERMHTGLDNSHRTAILDNGLKVSKLSFTADEMQEVEQAGLSIRAAANFLGLPSSKLGDVAGIKYASKEQDDLAFLNDGLDFWFCAVEDEAREKLLLESEKESGDYTVEFDRTTVARGDSAARANYNRTALAGQPWKTQNEVRTEEGLQPIDEAGADELRTPLNMGQGGADNEPEDVSERGPGRPSDDDEQAIDRERLRVGASAVLTDASRRMVRRVGVHAVKAAKEPKTFPSWVDSIEAEHGIVIRDALEPCEEMASAFGPVTVRASRRLIDEIRADYNALIDCTPAAKLAAATESLVSAMEQRIPALLVSEYFGVKR